MYIQERINKAFTIFCQEPSTENRNALIAECKDLVDVVLCLMPSWAAEDQEVKEDIRNEVVVLLIKFLDRRKGFDQVRNPSNYLFEFLKRNVMNCLHTLYSKPEPDQLSEVEKEEWTRPEPEATKLKSDPAMELKREQRKFYREQGGHFGPRPDKRTKEFQFYQKLFEESRKDFLESTRTNKDQFAPTKDWELDRKKIPERGRISSLIRIKPFLRKARFSKKTR